jgi:maltose alpha-D-glucosyltransferase/alpha-amylase
MPDTKTIIRKPGSVADPLWYKDAVIYEVHVKAFCDSNNDGIGDFPGLMQRLDYLQDLGVTCLWLLPFFPSPLRDDGYDISDYTSVHPSYGTLEEFQQFLHAAHDRGLQVMIELVINHSSDQHPWFQRARHAPVGSTERNYYVWSDTDQKYLDARIIFTDTEKSNWTWDPVAQAYYWHRFFSHQPDLNYDNADVLDEVLRVMRFWLDMGVDGLRIDAIPYLVERDGTSCENLPETHAVIKAIRTAIDESYAGRMVLAEANQWPTDVRPYFGDGDECHMAFHFPLMPRIYMALRQEDRLPITDIMAQTPAIPDNCQWGLFLRNHDELTLEMVSDDERDYMYLAYSADPRMRINIGIRRRLAPLLDNNRRRIELLNSILFSFPGTPILYYGDEIGMGDNIYLGDRNGVRTPMQWTPDRNAGFSRANPAKLYSPVIMDPVWGYEAINVEAQQNDPSSLLNWMRNMIALRKLFQVFGRGSLRFLDPSNRKILAYVRQYDDETVLCVANLSRFAQPVQLELSGMEGMTPVEMLGYVEFPTISKAPYSLTLGPYGFLWLEIQASANMAETASPLADEPAFYVEDERDWQSILSGDGVRRLEAILPGWLQKQRWFGSKSRTMVRSRIVDSMLFDDRRSALVWIGVDYVEGEPDSWLLCLSLSLGDDARAVQETMANQIVALAGSAIRTGVLHEGLARGAPDALLEILAGGTEIRTRNGTLIGVPGAMLTNLRGAEPLAVRVSSAEQSNTSAIFGDRLIMKLFRRQQPGRNPDVEIGRFLTESTKFANVPPFGGSIEVRRPTDEEPSTVVLLQGLVQNEGDGWQWTLDELDRYYESTASVKTPAAATVAAESDEPHPDARHYAGLYLDAAAMLGRRTAEMHLALASGHDAAFSPYKPQAGELEALRDHLAGHGAHAFDLLKTNLSRLPEDTVEQAGLALSRRGVLLTKFRALPTLGVGQWTRIHGDYHLGQVLRSKGDFVILDFEGEPARPLIERRGKYSPLKDVAGMLRSFSYAAFSGLTRYIARRPEDYAQLESWARLWEGSVSAEFLRAWRETAGDSSIVPSGQKDFDALLQIYMLDKALYELVYELNNRPAWIRIPLHGILSLPL